MVGVLVYAKGGVCHWKCGGLNFVFYRVCAAVFFFFFIKNPSMVIISPGNMNGGYFDELDTPDGSDYEGPPKVIFPRFMVPENDEDINFKVGLQFSNTKQILETIKTFVIMS